MSHFILGHMVNSRLFSGRVPLTFEAGSADLSSSGPLGLLRENVYEKGLCYAKAPLSNAIRALEIRAISASLALVRGVPLGQFFEAAF